MGANKTKHILYGTLFVVQMYRWGDTEGHTYTAGIFDNEADAKACGVAENIWRAGKYEPTIYQHNLNAWRNGTKQSMYKEIKDIYKDKSVEELFEAKEAWEIRLKKTDPDKYFSHLADKMRRSTEESKILNAHWAKKDKKQ